MNTLLLILLLSFIYSHGYAHKCVFHRYHNSNHYQSKRADLHTLLKSDLINHKNNQTHKHGRMLYGESRPAMVITLNTDDFNTIKTTSHG